MADTRTWSVVAVAIATSLGAFASLPAEAKCTRLAFSVNDYGKEGPTNDAKTLLDKYIAQTMAERGIKTFHTGKKDVTCELFLDFGFFDEHTCKAAATVCWPDGQGAPVSAGVAGSKTTTGTLPAQPAPKKATPAS